MSNELLHINGKLALIQNLFICKFQVQIQGMGTKWTWTSPDRNHTNMIDLTLIDKRWNTAVRLQELSMCRHSIKR